jgi:hypothetical protein
MQAYSDPTRADDPYALPDIEVFRMTASDFINSSEDTWMHERMTEDKDADSLAGWYWWSCFPGCLPDGDAIGPFASAEEALKDAQCDF